MAPTIISKSTIYRPAGSKTQSAVVRRVSPRTGNSRGPRETVALAGEIGEPVPRQTFEPVNLSVLQAQPSSAREHSTMAPPPAPPETAAPEMPEIPSVLPTTPVTLGLSRKSVQPLSAPEQPALEAVPATVPPPVAPVADASVKLDADFSNTKSTPRRLRHNPRLPSIPRRLKKPADSPGSSFRTSRSTARTR